MRKWLWTGHDQRGPWQSISAQLPERLSAEQPKASGLQKGGKASKSGGKKYATSKKS